MIKRAPCWGFSHEVGHVLQMRPQMNWGGLGEVSNNLFSLYTGGKMGNPSRLKVQRTMRRRGETNSRVLEPVKHVTVGRVHEDKLGDAIVVHGVRDGHPVERAEVGVLLQTEAG